MNFTIGKKEYTVDKIDVVKKVLGYGVTYGVGIIVYNIVKNHLPADLKIHKKIAVALGAWALGNIVQNAAEAYTNEFIDECVKHAADIKIVVEEFQQEMKNEKNARHSA
jgi:hypothetical protein